MRAAWIALILVAILTTIAVVFVMGMRAKNSPVVAGMRRVNRAVFNPRQLKSAGTPGAYAGVIHHVGRSSGRQYKTPVGIVPCSEGFAVLLVYGRKTDWLCNLEAAGGGEVVHEGRTHRVHSPEVRTMSTDTELFSASDQRSARVFNVKEFVVLYR